MVLPKYAFPMLGYDCSLILNRQILDGDGEERTVESDEDKTLMRRVAAESIVLLKNKGGVLPLNPQGLKKIAIVGGNAKAIVLSGGGSAALKASYYISPYDGIVNALSANKDVEITYSEGARGKNNRKLKAPYMILTINSSSLHDDAFSRL